MVLTSVFLMIFEVFLILLHVLEYIFLVCYVPCQLYCFRTELMSGGKNPKLVGWVNMLELKSGDRG